MPKSKKKKKKMIVDERIFFFFLQNKIENRLLVQMFVNKKEKKSAI